jgi:periplasmic divalent cation tolerance protein
MLVVITNLPDMKSAHVISRELIARQLAACVNILPAVHSIYRWQGKIEEAAEVTLVIKTTAARYDALEQAIVELHPYDIPEVIALPIARGLPAYLDWVSHESESINNVVD